MAEVGLRWCGATPPSTDREIAGSDADRAALALGDANSLVPQRLAALPISRSRLRTPASRV
jgi:hypothetical protein